LALSFDIDLFIDLGLGSSTVDLLIEPDSGKGLKPDTKNGEQTDCSSSIFRPSRSQSK
jgi:hypothetical protein